MEKIQTVLDKEFAKFVATALGDFIAASLKDGSCADYEFQKNLERLIVFSLELDGDSIYDLYHGHGVEKEYKAFVKRMIKENKELCAIVAKTTDEWQQKQKLVTSE